MQATLHQHASYITLECFVLDLVPVVETEIVDTAHQAERDVVGAEVKIEGGGVGAETEGG